MLTKNLKPGQIFRRKKLSHSLYQVSQDGSTAVRVLDRARGNSPRKIDLKQNPDIAVVVLTSKDIAELRDEKRFTGKLPLRSLKHNQSADLH